ncbi:MAG TPA: hypothetical protein VF502_19095 [Stellaceae bacterium]
MAGSANDDERIAQLMLAIEDQFERFRAAPDQKAEADVILEMLRLKKEVDAALSEQRAAVAALLDRARQATNDDERAAELVRAFALLTRHSYIAKEELGDVDASNETVDQRNAIADQLDAIGSGRRRDLAPLLEDADPGIRHAAACWLLRIMPERALPVLRDVAEKERGTTAGFRASTTLMMYESDPGLYKK